MKEKRIAIIGLGYVGLPLAVAFSEKYKVIGFDINPKRIAQLQSGKDITHEVENHVLRDLVNTKDLQFTDQLNVISECNVYIITVPTPTNSFNKPVLTPLLNASKAVGEVLKKGDLVIYESTVYPGVTEDECVPVLESTSGLQFNTDFFVGYSPERINPGDKNNTLTQILKITSGSTPQTAQEVDTLYKCIIQAGTYLAPSIKVAEAAKVIENSQRDINIAFVNELSKIFRLLDIDTQEVLKAAATKWNFIKFTPGLVGGHCIGVDPYYLADKAIATGYNPGIILAGRAMNDSMGKYVAQETIKLMIAKGIVINLAKALVLGITFKENCPDIRNSRVIDIINEFKSYHVQVDLYDPNASKDEVKEEYGLDLITDSDNLSSNYQAIVLAVAHKQFLNLDITSLKANPSVVFDVKAFLPVASVDGRL